MGKPASRLGDVSSHGGTLVLGVPTVMIGKMPAGTLGDMHVCPMVTGVVPHVGGPTALGSMGVLLGKKPAVRISDLALCVGPPDMMAMGCMTVLIGEVGSGGGGAGAAAAAAAKAAQLNGPKTISPFDPIEPAEPRSENHYVECAVTDSAGLPLPGLRYKLTDPDGKKIVGAVSSQGRIRHDGYSQAGSFKVEMACLANVKWSKTKCKPNEKLMLKADAEGMEDGTACAAMVFEASGDGNQRLLKSLNSKVQGKKIKIEWTLTTEELAKVHPDAPKGKVEYFFILVAAGNVGVSEAMQCLDTANIEILDPDEKPLAESKYELHLRDGSIRTGKTDKQGKAEEKEVPAGPYSIVLPEIVIKGKAPKTHNNPNTPNRPNNSRKKQKSIPIRTRSENETQLESTDDKVTISIGKIPSYHGELPSPFPFMWYVPKDVNELFKINYTPREIRQWVAQAAKYHEIPHVLLAVILQQENGPNATYFQKIGQFAERSLTTFAAIVDKYGSDIIPDKVAGGSTGIANMSRNTLIDAVKYVEKHYNRSPLPDDVRYRIAGYDQDTRISGDDFRADLYYASAHLRQLIDRCMKTQHFFGQLTLDDFEKICASYNGSGPLAKKYGKDARALLESSIIGEKQLFFYEE